MQENKFIVTFSPHLRDECDVSKIMLYVIIALLPAVFTSIFFYGYYAIKVYVLSIVFTLFFEYIFQRLRKRSSTLSDNSALVTALLLAMNLPPSADWWLILIGSFIAIVIGKMVFGGLGHNVFNPVLVARVFLLISWPFQMTNWVEPSSILKGLFYDAESVATPLGQVKTEVLTHGKIITEHMPSFFDIFTGNIAGSMGEMSALMLLIGAIFLFYKKVITWHIPISYIVSFLLIIVPYWLLNPDKTLDPVTHLFTGGLILGAFFMATDLVTSPISARGQLIFGFGCGIVTAVIRLFGGYPEGVSFAILIMNAFVPLIDYYLKEPTFGQINE
ncbi:MAG: RnfABCDGE type electron transport complex subunit D [Deferribacterota bacterium]|nr:RnfABCDGE type electron transport complex subunit D [Deferribacterota bacterium]